MKKLLLFFAAILFGISASFAQVDNVHVTWVYNPETCTCETELAADFFEISVSIYDDANSQWVVQDKTVYENVAVGNGQTDVAVPEVSTYCGKSHGFTPSFTVYATVWLVDDDPPPTKCCSTSDSVGPKSCHEFYNGDVDVPAGTLN